MVNILHVGDRYRIEVSGNITTGYSWSYYIIGDQGVISVNEEYVPLPNPGGVVGRGGTTIFSGQALRPGHVTLVLEYSRPWENVPAAETKRYSVTVV